MIGICPDGWPGVVIQHLTSQYVSDMYQETFPFVQDNCCAKIRIFPDVPLIGQSHEEDCIIAGLLLWSQRLE